MYYFMNGNCRTIVWRVVKPTQKMYAFIINIIHKIYTTQLNLLLKQFFISIYSIEFNFQNRVFIQRHGACILANWMSTDKTQRIAVDKRTLNFN